MVGLNGSALPSFAIEQEYHSSPFTAKADRQNDDPNPAHRYAPSSPTRIRSRQTSRGPKPLLPRSLKEALQLAELLAKSKLIPKGFETPETCLVGILYGMEVGLSPIAALQRMAVIDGRPTIWGDAALALVQASGLLQSIEEELVEKEDSENRKILTAICKVKREGRLEPTIGTFSIDDAKRAGLWQKPGPWTDYPKRMLTMRARAFALRDAFPDVLAGLYIREEFDGAEKRQSTSSQERPIRDDADWNAIADQQSKSSSVLRRAPPPPPPSASTDYSNGILKEPVFQLHDSGLSPDPQSPDEITSEMVGDPTHQELLDPETILEFLDSALCCALDLPTLEEIVDDFAERLSGISKDHQKRAQKIIDRHYKRVVGLDQQDLSASNAPIQAADLPRGLKSLLPHLGIGRRPSKSRRERRSGRLSRSLAILNVRQPVIDQSTQQIDQEISLVDDQKSAVGE